MRDNKGSAFLTQAAVNASFRLPHIKEDDTEQAQSSAQLRALGLLKRRDIYPLWSHR